MCSRRHSLCTTADNPCRPMYDATMEHIGSQLQQTARNIEFDRADLVSLHGFTQVPNFVLRKSDLSPGSKVVFAMFLSYAWHNNFCFPGQERLAEDMGMSRSRVTEFVTELEKAGLISVQRRGQGKTNIYTVHFQVTTKPKTKQSRPQTS